MIPFAAIAAILVFLYINNHVRNKREERRARQLERHEELLEATLKQLRNKAGQEKNENHEN